MLDWSQHTMKKETIGILLRVALVIFVFLVISFGVSSVIKIPAFSLDRNTILAYLSSFSSWAPVIYIFFQILTIPLIPVPSAILATVAGTLFGFIPATIYTTIAWVIGTTINFSLTRIFGRPLLKKLLRGSELSIVDRFSQNLNWKIIFFSWFIPGGTADIAGYSAGITKMAYKRYILSAGPAALLLAILASGAGAVFKMNPIFASILAIGAVVGILFGAKVLVVYHLIKRPGKKILAS